MARLVLAFLGPLQVMVDNQPVDHFAYDKVRALLAFLVVNCARSHHRDMLAALLWPDTSVDTARNNLRTALATLRKTISDHLVEPPFLAITRNTIQFNPTSDYTLDVPVFINHLAAVAQHAHPHGQLCTTCAERLTQAVALYQGDFLQQVRIPDSVAWEEWVVVTREGLHHQAIGALAQLAAYHEQRRENELARHYAWRQLALEPWDEDAHRCLMRVFMRLGQRHAALTQYEQCRRVLAEELRVEPEAETTALYERIRANANPEQGSGTAPFLDPPWASGSDHAAVTDAPDTTTASLGLGYNDELVLSSVPADQTASSAFPVIAPTEIPYDTPPPPQARSDRNRQHMLTKVKRFWITGVLEQSLHNAALIELGLALQPEAVISPWSLIVQTNQLPQLTLATTNIAAVYDACDGELLILGPPGAGKTTTLLVLARTLIERAEHDPSLPIPVVFNLSSWGAYPRPLNEWLVDELMTRYQVPRTLGQYWIAMEQVVPLLDGLDEVASAQRVACVTAINSFRAEHWLLDTVVCSRSADYALLTDRLCLQGAVLIQSLTATHVDTYLAQAGDQLVSVRHLLHEDTLLRDLIDTPLMLTIVVLAYQPLLPGEPPVAESLEDRRTRLFDTYVQHMLLRRPVAPPYTQRQLLDGLVWLAQLMRQHNQTLFALEGLQPSWLPSPTARRAYMAGLGALLGIGVPILFGLSRGMAVGLAYALVLRGWESLTMFLTAIGHGLVGGVIGGLIGGVSGWILSSRPWSDIPTRWQSIQHGLGLGLGMGVGVGTVSTLGVDPVRGVINGLLALLIFGVSFGMITYPGKITVVEHLRWSWTATRRRWVLGMAIGLLWGILFGLWNGVAQQVAPTLPFELLPRATPGLEPTLARGLVRGLAPGLALGVVLSLAFGLTSDEVATKTAPNEGIRQSARNALRVGLLLGMVFGLTTSLVNGLLIGLVRGPGVGVAIGLVSLPVPVLVIGCITGLVYGGFACMQHLVLRGMLYGWVRMPWNYAQFLEAGVERLLLQRVGGGFMFVHRLLLDYFVDQHHESNTTGTTPNDRHTQP